MTYEQWKAILEPITLLLSGAGAGLYFQKLYREIRKVPACDHSAMDKQILREIRELKDGLMYIDYRLEEVEKIARPNTE